MGRKAAELENLLWGLWDVSVCNDYLTRPCCPPLLNQLKPPPVHRLRNYPARSGVISSFGELSKAHSELFHQTGPAFPSSPTLFHYFTADTPTAFKADVVLSSVASVSSMLSTRCFLFSFLLAEQSLLY